MIYVRPIGFDVEGKISAANRLSKIEDGPMPHGFQ
jgi:hypothetical protein